MIYYANELYHYGIKGQKWGDRNYQYEDGSLTPEGKIRYGVGDGRRGSISEQKSTSISKKTNSPQSSTTRKKPSKSKIKMMKKMAEIDSDKAKKGLAVGLAGSVALGAASVGIAANYGRSWFTEGLSLLSSIYAGAAGGNAALLISKKVGESWLKKRGLS